MMEKINKGKQYSGNKNNMAEIYLNILVSTIHVTGFKPSYLKTKTHRQDFLKIQLYVISIDESNQTQNNI